ncbi:hypothetical protein [Nostoc linckia]|uniref:hypothetical protein n=1 Tax=Nostoc linckia TaxID=92942 RepID=UPI0015D48B3C|nr:hypothetical protein [Nostoc linckia]
MGYKRLQEQRGKLISPAPSTPTLRVRASVSQREAKATSPQSSVISHQSSVTIPNLEVI